jgi:hypothetical protein
MRGLDRAAICLRRQPHTSVVIAGLDPAIHHDEWALGCTSLRTNLVVRCTSASPTISFGAHSSIAKDRLEGFTKRHNVKMLVYYERHETVPLAIQREKISSTGRANVKLI